MAGTYRYTATHAKPRPPWVTRVLLIVGALLVTVTLGFGGYAAGTAIVTHAPPVTHAKVIQPGSHAHVTPAPHRSAPAPTVPAHAMHAAHLWHVLHLAHLAHVAWLASHGVQTE